EYKAMGLAPYGDPKKFRSIFNNLVILKSHGQYELASFSHMKNEFKKLFPTPPTRENMEQKCYCDFIASLQESLERIVFHVLHHWQNATGLRDLCLAGGVAHNCTLNGKILSSNLFSSVFVQPAAHDAGGALGAAIYASLSINPN